MWEDACKPMTIGIDRELESIIDVELGENRGEVMSYCRLADTQPISNRLVLQPLADEIDDLTLSGS